MDNLKQRMNDFGGRSGQERSNRSSILDLYSTCWAGHWRRHMCTTESLIGWRNTSPKFWFLFTQIAQTALENLRSHRYIDLSLKLDACCINCVGCEHRFKAWITYCIFSINLLKQKHIHINTMMKKITQWNLHLIPVTLDKVEVFSVWRSVHVLK